MEVGFPIDQGSKLNIILAATFPLKCTSFLTSIIELVSLFILQCKYNDFIVSVIRLQTQQSQTDVRIKGDKGEAGPHMKGCIHCGSLLAKLLIEVYNLSHAV